MSLPGFAEVAHQLNEAPLHWPEVRVEQAVPDAPRIVEEVAAGEVLNWRLFEEDDETAVRTDVWLRRDELKAVFYPRGRSFDANEMVHPCSTFVAATTAGWLNRVSFHAGAFVLDGGAWVVVGGRGLGKTSLLAQLSEMGLGVLADDLVVLEGRTVLAGPRCLDLRRGAAEWFAAEGVLCRTGGADPRWRVPLEPVCTEVPVRGLILLGWSPRMSVQRVRAGHRIGVLDEHYNGGADTEERLLDLIALPCLRFERPPDWGSMKDGAQALLDHLLAGYR